MTEDELRRALSQKIKAAGQANLQEDHLRAQTLYKEALALAEALKDQEQQAQILGFLGREAYELGLLEEAVGYYQRVQALARGHYPALDAFAWLEQGRLYTRLGKTEAAKTAFLQGLQRQRSIPLKADQGEFLRRLGDAYWERGDAKQGLQFSQQAEKLYRERGDKAGLAMVLSRRGRIYMKTKQLQKALETFLESMALHGMVGNWHRVLIDNNEIGRLYGYQGDYEKSHFYFQKTLALEKEHPDPQLAGEALAELGDMAAGREQNQEAVRYFQLASDAFGHALNRTSQVWVISEQGILLAKLGQKEKARACLEQARKLVESIQSPRFEASLARQFGLISQALGDTLKAREWYERGLVLQKEIGDKEAQIGTLLVLAPLVAHEPERFRSYLEQAQVLYQSVANRIGEVEVLTAKGDLERRAGQGEAAEKAYRQAITLVEQLRFDAGSGLSAQATFFERLRAPYVGYFQLLVEQRRASEAFALVQKTKARGLLDLMAGGKIRLSRQLTAQEQAEEGRRQARCEQLSAQMVAEAAQNAPGSKKRFEDARAALAVAERERALYQDQLFARYAGLGTRRAATTIGADEAGQVLPPEAALLELALMEDRSLVALVLTRDPKGGGEVTSHTIRVPQAELSKHAQALRVACSSPKGAWQKEAAWLYQALLAPLEPRLKGKTQLILCPDRLLWDVPFAVLTSSQGIPLLERFALSYASSATAWHAAQAIPRRAPSAPTLLVLANPQFEVEKRFGGSRPLTAPNRPITAPNRPLTAPNRDVLLPRGTRLTDLPGTQREADALAKRFPRATLYTRSKAQESAVKRHAKGTRWLHIATHAFVNDAAPLLSSVVLANPTVGSGEDGFLTAREIFDLDLSGVELVVLSACNTARGQTQGGEGVVGLTWALFAAGCPTQVLSQWAVDDSSTAALMTRFYDGLAKEMSKGSALRRAALTLRGDRRYVHPYYWAPFVLIGNPR